jgi:Icc protein
MKKAILFSLAILLVLSGCTKKQKEAADEFTFAFLTDIHLQPELNAVEGFRKAIDTINQLAPDFVLTGGDLVMDALDQTYGRVDSLYKLYIQVSKEFNMPVYNAMGNHEIYGWHRHEEGIADNPEYGKKMFENRIGKRYYSFDHKGWHFIVMDGIELGEDGYYYGHVDNDQIGWLKGDLEKVDKKTPIAVITHIPFITVQTQLTKGTLEPNPKGLVITNGRDVLLNFLDYNLKLVLQGHLHFLEDINVQNEVHFITGGAICGRWWNNKINSWPQEGFLLVRVKGEEFEWEYVDYGWVTETERKMEAASLAAGVEGD